MRARRDSSRRLWEDATRFLRLCLGRSWNFAQLGYTTFCRRLGPRVPDQASLRLPQSRPGVCCVTANSAKGDACSIPRVTDTSRCRIVPIRRLMKWIRLQKIPARLEMTRAALSRSKPGQLKVPAGTESSINPVPCRPAMLRRNGLHDSGRRELRLPRSPSCVASDTQRRSY